MMNISYDKVKNEYILGELRYTKETFISYINSDMLQSALLTKDGTFEIENENEDKELENKESNLGKISRVANGTNVILYGVPGSGKSWTIEHEYCKKDSNVERLVFHPDYTYSDFIGQILPNVSEDGQVSYKFTPGPFTNILAEAYSNPGQEYILIIEEINRGNAPAIFGEVFQLLDRKTEIQEKDDDGFSVGTSEYGITNANIANIVYGDSKHKVRIPSNLSIIGTMNTSDQNVFTLDTAFQRRWDMRLIENNFDNVDPKLADAEILDTTVTWRNFCTAINGVIVGNGARMVSSEDKRLGAYFVRFLDLQKDERMGNLSDGEYERLCKAESTENLTDTEKARLAVIREAMKQYRKFPEKVIKYLWDDAFKFNREIVFETSDYQSLEQVIRAFMYAEGLARFDMFKENIKSAFTNTEN
ncbi:MAG: AAA family ATPase [Lachnospiraceae bacterium]